MRTLSIDIETFSSNDLVKGGMYKYAEATDFTILLLAYCFDSGPVKIIDLTCEEMPQSLLQALTDNSVLKTAHNAMFERTCLSRHFGISLPPEQWACTMARSAQVGLPLSLDQVARILQLTEQKMTEGKQLIRYFCLPCKPTKVNGGRIRNLPQHDMQKWETFKTYCVNDVVVERAIAERLGWFKPTESEKQVWFLDQRINDRGVLTDPQFIGNAIKIDVASREQMTREAIRLTGLDNPNSVAQLKGWLELETDEKVSTLNKETVPELIKKTANGAVKQVLELRQMMAKSSVKKYTAMVSCMCADQCVRGLLQYYGANRTGRWAGRLIQLHNLPQNHLKDLSLARQLVKQGDSEMLEMLFGNVPDTLSQLIRTSFIAKPGHRFIVADFSAIEARVIAWLAGEKWRLEVFNTHGKIYEASAAQMFKVPLETVTKGSPLRQKGKIAELALGYQGAAGALEKMGALKMGIPAEELPKLVSMWRQANKKIVQLWANVEAAAIAAVGGEPQIFKYGIKFFTERNVLFIQLPSGRRLSYLRPQLISRMGNPSLVYQGMNQTTKQWGLQDTYGGKLVENIVQAIARDLLADAMLRLDREGYAIVFHVHDEVVMEMLYGKGSTAEVDKIMGTPVPWAKGLPLKAESFETEFYKKD